MYHVRDARRWSSGVVPKYLTESDRTSGTVTPSPLQYRGDTFCRAGSLERYTQP